MYKDFKYKDFECEIRTDELVRPIGIKYFYRAIITLYKITKTGNNEKTYPKIKEIHGKTIDETLKKAEDEIKKWIDNNHKSFSN